MRGSSAACAAVGGTSYAQSATILTVCWLCDFICREGGSHTGSRRTVVERRRLHFPFARVAGAQTSAVWCDAVSGGIWPLGGYCDQVTTRSGCCGGGFRYFGHSRCHGHCHSTVRWGRESPGPFAQTCLHLHAAASSSGFVPDECARLYHFDGPSMPSLAPEITGQRGMCRWDEGRNTS
jgi:hypothetical protein